MEPKQYGLIDPKKVVKKPTTFSRLSAFNSDSDSDEKTTASKRKVNLTIGELQKRQIKKAQDHLISEDPTIFQYDELFDDMQTQKESKKVKKPEEKGPKYIKRLLVTAELRKKEYERRIERQVQKERETEGEEFKDKESFVTSSYRLKLEEMKQAEEAEKRSDYLESIGDVTKQRDLGGFYRHLYEQKMGSDKATTDASVINITTTNPPEQSAQTFTGDKTTTSKKDRTYRKRKSSDAENSAEEKDEDIDAQLIKKTHIQSNLDADSDFSIDSDSDSDTNENTATIKPQPTNVEKIDINDVAYFIKPEPVNVPIGDKVTDLDVKQDQIEVEIKIEEKPKSPKPKKEDIWRKRTVGAILEAAIQRYYERKVARELN